MAVGVAEVRGPELSGDVARLDEKFHAALAEGLAGGTNALDRENNLDRPAQAFARTAEQQAQHQRNAAAVEKRKVCRLIFHVHPQLVAIEFHGALEVPDAEHDSVDLPKFEVWHNASSIRLGRKSFAANNDSAAYSSSSSLPMPAAFEALVILSAMCCGTMS